MLVTEKDSGSLVVFMRKHYQWRSMEKSIQVTAMLLAMFALACQEISQKVPNGNSGGDFVTMGVRIWEKAVLFGDLK